MQSLQAMSKSSTQSSNLPPLENLPSWSRNSLGRRKQARAIVRDRLQPVKAIREEIDENSGDVAGENSNNSGRIVSAPSRGHGPDQAQKLDNLEKRIEFLRTQHAETLAYLHSEIERLKTENKELSFKLVMARTGVNLQKENPSQITEETTADSVVTVENNLDVVTEGRSFSQSEGVGIGSSNQSVQCSTFSSTVEDVPSQVAKRNKRQASGKKAFPVKSSVTPAESAKSSTVKSKNSAPTKTKQSENQEKKKAPSASSSEWSSSLSVSPSSKQSVSLGQSVLIVTIKDKTVQVHVPADGVPRSPTLVECKAIIKHQQETNQRQQKELSKLKSDLNDALYADKWTPDSYLLAKSYMTDDMSTNTRQNTPAARSLPRLHSREHLTQSGRLAGRMHVVQDSVSLPVLRPNAAPTVTERKRRQQAVVRARGKKDLF